MVYHIEGFKPPGPIADELRGKSARQMLDELGIQSYKRLQIPLETAHSLGRISDILRDLAASLALQSRCPEGSELKALQAAWWELEAANRRIAGIQKVRRNTKSGGPASD